MKIDTSKIAGFDEMSAEDKIKALSDFEYEVPEDRTDDIKRLKELNDQYSSQIASMKKEQKKNLDDGERARLETQELLDALRAENESLKRSQTVANLKASYLSMGYEDKLANKKAEAMADNNMEKVLACEQEYREYIEKSIRADVVKSTPKPDTMGKGTEVMTKDKLRQMSPADRFKFSQEHADEYKRIYQGE